MTPEQALAILDQATSQLAVSRQAHQQIGAALSVLQRCIAPAPKPVSVPNEGKKKTDGAIK